MLISGGEVDTERAAKMLVGEFRASKWGRLSLERPPHRDTAEEVDDYAEDDFPKTTRTSRMTKTKPSSDSLYAFDAEKRAAHGVICGVDEAGRGPLCGPVCCAAVILNPDNPIEGVNELQKADREAPRGFV